MNFTQTLEALKETNLYRSPRVLENLKGVRANFEGRPVILFCGNDYLGLSEHPKVVKAAKIALEVCGVGSGSARLISGTGTFHDALEQKIASFLQKESALLFSSGYLANLGVLTALTDKDDLIALDKLSHASLIDAAQAAKAELRIFPHRNMNYLRRLLSRSKAKRKWIVTDSVFSMDGDLAPIQELVQLKHEFKAVLMLDEAHGFGIFGKGGRGAAEAADALDQVDIVIGTCSKALGSVGGFVSGTRETIEMLVNFARTFIFDTALPQAICAASLEALQIIEANPKMREHLFSNTKHLREGLHSIKAPVIKGESPIVPLLIGDEKNALQMSTALLKKGFLVPAIRYPAVARGSARLRLTVSVSHTSDQIDSLSIAIRELFSGRQANNRHLSS